MILMDKSTRQKTLGKRATGSTKSKKLRLLAGRHPVDRAVDVVALPAQIQNLAIATAIVRTSQWAFGDPQKAARARILAQPWFEAMTQFTDHHRQHHCMIGAE